MAAMKSMTAIEVARGSSIRSGRACGKVILAGEHAAVYGFPAVAVGIERGAIARVTPLDVGESQLTIGDIEPSDDDRLARAFGVVLADFAAASPTPALPVRVEIVTNLPAGSGLGSSAAIGVALIRALAPLAPEAEILRRAMLWEQVFHGNPSGLDAVIATRGGCHTFERGKKGISIRVPKRAYLCVGQSGAGASTKAMVDSVAALRIRAPELAQEVFNRIGALAGELAASLRSADFRGVGRLMRDNHALLQRLSLSTPAIDAMCERARSAGAHGAKLTGGGGGGCVVALCETVPEADAVLAAWRRASFDGFIAPIGPSDDARPSE